MERVIDVAEAYDALKACAEGSRSSESRPLLNRVFARIGLPADTLQTARLLPESEHPRGHRPDHGMSGLTLGALLVLRAAERAERCGADAQAAVRHARAVLLKYVSVVPSSLFPSAPAGGVS